ncbi:MAG: 2-amino-4-hydroxy-6-hydroxymethyldihydropteridine diphosphokinase [Aquificota bacterium]|nr:MAG: 2-amino-4-hydroxy-6-hydroxymethyldihydropteridine diphosphokinase [Aquificota bacterium]
MHTCYIAFGSNKGNRLEYILKALELLKELGVIKKVSTVYESEPWGVTKQEKFLNGVIEFSTKLEPIKLLFELKRIEELVGRQKGERWGPREVDLDIVLYENYIIMLSFLRIPHPYMTERDFVLFPLLELNPDIVHPITKVKLREYTKKLPNRLTPYACLLPP